MEIIKSLDLEWFWRGYTAGANSRKRLVESPNKMTNLGKQGIITTPTAKQQISFFIGVKMGRGKIVQNFDPVYSIQYQDKNPHKSKGDWLTFSLGKTEGEKGQTVRLPLYISNNSVDNRGFCGFQAKIKYNPTHIILNKISSSSSWTSSFKYEHDATGGIVFIQGLRDEVGYEDMVVGYLDFYITDDALSTNYVYLQGPTGQGTGSDLLTLINGEHYYIQPLTLEDGEIKVLDEEEPEDEDEKDDVVTLPPIGSSDTHFGEDTEFTYDFELGLGYIGSASGGGSGSGSGASLGVEIEFGDGSSQTIYIPLEEGVHHYKGKIPIKLPSLKPGPVIIKIWLEQEDEDDIYYWFIKAGALWGFETTIPREEVGNLPIRIPKRVMYENFKLYDFAVWWQESGGSSGELVSSVSVNEIMQLFDDFELKLGDSVEDSESIDKDIFILSDSVEFRQG